MERPLPQDYPPPRHVLRDLRLWAEAAAEPPAAGIPVVPELFGATGACSAGALAVLALAGPEAKTVLRRLTHLHHFPAGGEVAHITAHVLEQDGAYWIVFAQEYGHYLWDVAVDRASALGGGPVGVDAFGAAA